MSKDADLSAANPQERAAQWGYVQVRVCPLGVERAPVGSRTVTDWRAPNQAAAALREIADDLDAKESW